MSEPDVAEHGRGAPEGVSAPGLRLTAGLMAGVAVYAMDALAIQVALPRLARDLNAEDRYQLVVSVYLLGSLFGLVAAGARERRVGLARAMDEAIWVFISGLLLSAVAPGLPGVLAGRLAQGVGGGMLSTVIYAAVQRAYPAAERPRMLALLGTAWATAATTFPLLLGPLTEYVHWRAVFLPGIPALLAMGAACRAPLRAFVASGGEGKGELRAALGIGGGAALLMLGTAELWPAVDVAARVVGAVLLLVALFDFLPDDVRRFGRGRPAALAGKTSLNAAFVGVELYFSKCLEHLHGWKPTYVGLGMAAASISWAAAVMWQSKALPRWGTRRMTALGCVVAGLGTTITFQATRPGMSPAFAIVGWTIATGGLGIAFNTFTEDAMETTPEGDENRTGTLLGFTDALGGVLGASLAQLGAQRAGGLEGPTLGDAIGAAWIVGGSFLLPALLLTTRLGRRAREGAVDA